MSQPEPKKELSLPTAVLAGSVVIAIAVFLGLRQRSPDNDGDPPARPGLTSSPQPSAVAPPPAPTPVVASNELRQLVEKQATEALEAKRKLFVETCWAPSVKERPTPASCKYTFNMSFDPSGKEVGRGISEVRGADRPDVGQCLRRFPMDIQVPPPGTVVTIDAVITLP